MVRPIYTCVIFALAGCFPAASVATGPATMPATSPVTAEDPSKDLQLKLNDGFGGGGGGKIARFGPPGAGADGPRGRQPFEDQGEARKVVFVYNVRHVMTCQFGSPKEDLNRAVVRLRIPKAFDLIFVAGKAPPSFVRDKLKLDDLAVATADNKRAASAFLEDLSLSNETDALPAVDLAFSRKPDLIYLVADSGFGDNDALLRKVRELNKDRKVKINCVTYTDERAPELPFLKVLKTIAEESGGTLKQVNPLESD